MTQKRTEFFPTTSMPPTAAFLSGPVSPCRSLGPVPSQTLHCLVLMLPHQPSVHQDSCPQRTRRNLSARPLPSLPIQFHFLRFVCKNKTRSPAAVETIAIHVCVKEHHKRGGDLLTYKLRSKLCHWSQTMGRKPLKLAANMGKRGLVGWGERFCRRFCVSCQSVCILFVVFCLLWF